MQRGGRRPDGRRSSPAAAARGARCAGAIPRWAVPRAPPSALAWDRLVECVCTTSVARL